MHPVRAILFSLVLVVISALPVLAQSSGFGLTVVVDGDDLIIGEPNNSFRQGTVYVYRKSGDTWAEVTRLQAEESERADGFGAVLALDGDTLFVAQRGGMLHAFERDGSSWRSSGTLSVDGLTGPDPGCGQQYGYCGTDFGIAIAIEGDWMMVGKPGRAASAGGRGGRGTPQPAEPGAVYIFRRGGSGRWTLQGSLEPTDGIVAGDSYGRSIAFSDGRVFVGAPTRAADVVAQPQGGGRRRGRGPSPVPEDTTPVPEVGRVFEFRYENGNWRETASLGSENERAANFGAAISLEGNTAVIGAPGSGDGHGAAYVYKYDEENGVWEEHSRLAAFSGIRGDRFGTAVAIDGKDVWVGSPAPRGTDTGMVYLYRDEGGELLGAPRRIFLKETVTRDAFGDRIASSGGIAAVSATGMDHQAGAVYVYERNTNGEWEDRGELVSEPDALPALLGEVRECTNGKIGPFDCDGIDLLAFIPGSMLKAEGDSRGVRTNDNWGWTDPVTGREYALIGRNDGTSFFDITDPLNPLLVGDLAKTQNTPPSQLWRDIKFYNEHAFIVADGAGAHGMQVFDMSKLRDVPNMPMVFQPDSHYDLVESVHNIAINTETGFAYLVGANGRESCGGGLHMIDIRDPLNPKFAGCFRDERGTHDVQCAVYRGPDERYEGREICLKANGGFLSVSDVTDKESPVLLGRGTYPNPAYLHQGWLTDDHAYFIMDDESDVIRGNAETTRTTIWDLSDLEDPLLTTMFMGSVPASAHNLYVKGDFVYQANYRYGLHILDITDPENPVEAGMFDTAPYLEGPGFSGAWSNYPFFESGTIIVTSLMEGAFLLRKQD
ncbi:MAG: choice-of-anchor B family protein [Acidobacteriota bacterium]|nr:choice-of-anchor B family protein [Acidobacteriota bacterium]